MRTAVLGSLSLAIIFVGCSKQGPQYFPETSVGSRYEYSVEFQSLFGGVQKAEMVIRIDSQETINGKRYQKQVIEFSGIPGVDQQISYYRRSPEGVWAIEGANKGKPEFLEIPFPLKVGNAWISNAPSMTSRYQAVGIETVEVAGRTYKDCLKVSFTHVQTDGTGTEYCAPGIGIVKMTMNENGVPMTFSLRKYAL